MFASHLRNHVRPVGVLLGGSGFRRIVAPKKSEVGVLLQPRTDPGASRAMPIDFVALPCEVDCHDHDRKRASALVIEMAMDDPERILERSGR